MTCHHPKIDGNQAIGPRIKRVVCLSCGEHEWIVVQDVGEELDDVAARLDRFQVFGERAGEEVDHG